MSMEKTRASRTAQLDDEHPIPSRASRTTSARHAVGPRRSIRLARLVAGALLAATSACDGEASDGAEGQAAEVVVDAENAFDLVPGCPHPKPKVIDCSLAWDGGPHYTVRVRDGERLEETERGLTVTMTWSEAEHDSDSFTLGFATETGNFDSTLFQVSDCGPVNQFHGMHGFTGLRRVEHPTDEAVSVQMACFVRSPDDPMIGWDTLGI